MQTAIQTQFDDLIKTHPKEMRDALIFFEKELASRNCKFGDDIIPSFIKPLFIEKQQAQKIDAITKHIISILEKVTQLYFSHPELRELFYLDERGKELVEIDPGYSCNVVISRPDAFLVDGSLRFVEFNCDSPAGAGYTDIEEDVLKESFPLKLLSKDYTFSPHSRIGALLEALLSAYHEFAGSNKKPNIAIVDWKDVRTWNEFIILQSDFKKKGYDTVVADPRELKFNNGKLEHNGFPIDLVYRRVIFRELLENFNDVQDLITAYRKGKICMVNPLRSRLASNKAILSIITNQKEYKDFFSPEENKVIKKHVPWTRRVIDTQIVYEENEVFLRNHIIHHKDHLVIKPSDSYGGKDVTIGHETEQASWDKLVSRIFDNSEDWVVQRYVTINEMPMPVVKNGVFELQTKKFNINPFIFYGKYAGSVTRLSDQSVINVSAGGGLVPVIEYEKVTKSHGHKVTN